jgi:ABC-2 type transport system permease protein
MTTALTHCWYMSLRELRNLARQPWWILITLAQPLVYLLIYSALFEQVAEIPGFTGGSYLDFFTPGIVVVTALFSGGWAGMNVINDLDRGVLDRLLVSPVNRGALITGRLMQGAIIAVIQSLIIVGLALALGAELPGGVLGVVALIAAAVLIIAGFGALSIALALLVRREESVIGAVQMLLLPLTFLSTAFMARELMPGWIQDASRFNPLDWAVDAGREAVSASADWSHVLTHVGYLLAFTLVCAWLAARAFRAYQRSV